MSERSRWSWCGLVALALALTACPGKKNDAAGDSAGAVTDTSQPQPKLPASGAAADSARGADSAGTAAGTVRDTTQPQPRAGSESKPGAATKAPASSGGAAKGTASEDDTVRIRRLEQEARALAKVDGCSGSEQCRAAPVGNRPCGGPRTYIPYCARTTDSAALFRKLEQLAEAERAYNAKRGIGSTCEFRSPPPVEESGGRCSLRTAQPGAPRLRAP